MNLPRVLDKMRFVVGNKMEMPGLKLFVYGGGPNDKREAKALSYKHEKIDVFACCYGIEENVGFSRPGTAIKEALLKGATQSKDCRGVIYIYPSGNGHLDNCNADGYANSVDTITIAAVNRTGHIRQNGEVCAASIAAAVGGGYNTTTLNHLCSGEFKGSSAACAVSAGFVGELRVIRPYLSKRDIEHIMVKTAVPGHDKQWRKNGAGLMFNDYIGFGQLDLEKMKKEAKTWNYVPRRNICHIDLKDKYHIGIYGAHWAHITEILSDGCRGKQEVNYLEHVQVHMDLNCNHISKVAIQLTSPAKTVSNILSKINMSKYYEERSMKLNWTFMSVNFWNEGSVGVWTVKVMADNASKEVTCRYYVKRLTLYGTKTNPYNDTNQPITCEVQNSMDKNSGHSSSILQLPSTFVQYVPFLFTLWFTLLGISYNSVI